MNMTRSRLVALITAALIAVLAIPAAASALGPGGWGNLGAQTGAPTTAALNGRATVMSTDMPGKLIVGGAFTSAGVPAASTTDDDHIAIWNGTTWSPVGPGAGLNGDVNALEVDGSRIFAGGVFTNAGTGLADGLAMWDTNNPGLGWQHFCNSPNNAGVAALKIVGNTLYIGSSTQDWFAAGPGDASDYLVRCDLTSGGVTAMVDMDGDATGSIAGLASDANGDLYAGGSFINWDSNTIGNNNGDYVVKYTNLPTVGFPANVPVPSALNNGISGTNVDSVATIGNDLYVGTDVENVDGIAQADHVVRWNGSAWSAAGTDTAGTNGYFGATINADDYQSLTVSGTTLFVSGNWSNADGDPLSDKVARFDSTCTPQVPAGETCWDHVGSNGALTDGPFSQNLNRGLAVFNNRLHVGGNFSDAGGDPLADSIACFPLAAQGSCILPPVVNQPPAAVTQTPLTPISGPTGQRAAALKKCKKKTGAARKRCKKRALKLPE
jgi:hypothetical protein